jgi:hypothetical protein
MEWNVFHIFTFFAKYWNDLVKKDEVGGAYGTYVVEEIHAGFWWGQPEARETSWKSCMEVGG